MLPALPLRLLRRVLLVTPLLLAASSCAAPGAERNDTGYSITVSAGDHWRRSTPASFTLPDEFRNTPLQLRGADGEVLAVQTEAGGDAFVIIDSMAPGSVAEYRLERAPSAKREVTAARRDESITLYVGARRVLTYHGEPTTPPRPDIDPVYQRGGYIHPLYTPQGVVVTGDYPPDHVHHHGIWAAWTRARFRDAEVDFWNVADRRGDVLPEAVDNVWDGPVHGGFSARHRYVSLVGGSPEDALRERWKVRLYAVEGGDRPYWLLDLEVDQEAATADPLILPTYHYGGVALRGRDDWYGAENAEFLTSEGHDRLAGNETRARWTHLGGSADGDLRGIAVLSHKDNFRHPEPVRLHPNEPYFSWTPSQLGEWEIRPGEPHRVRYRYVVHDGEVDPAELDRLWVDFVEPPVVTVSR